MISWSVLASPGGSSALYFHANQRAELTNEPSFSEKFDAGRRKTSVFTSAVEVPSSSSAMRFGFQNEAVSVSKFSATTRYFSFLRELITFRECGPLFTGFMPKLKKPSIMPFDM